MAKAPKFPERKPRKKKIRQASGSKVPSDVSTCARKVANHRYRKDLDYQKYVKASAIERVAREKEARKKKKAQEAKAQKEKEEPRRKLILKIPKAKKKK